MRLPGRGGSATVWLNQLNKNEAPSNALWVTSGLTQVLMIIAGIYSAGYAVLLKFSTSLSIVPYLFVALYALKSVIKGTGFENRPTHERVTSGILAVLAVAFAFFMIFGAGLRYLLLAAIVWMTGFWFFYKGKKEQNLKFTTMEKICWVVIALMAIAGLIGLFTGKLVVN